MLAATGSASNFYFWAHSGYFTSPTSKPLLHTWSLAVEERFYISFSPLPSLGAPLLPRAASGCGFNLLSVVSFVTSCIVVGRNPETAFYMPYTRAFGVFAGNSAVARHIPARLRSAWLRNIATLSNIQVHGFACGRFYFIHRPRCFRVSAPCCPVLDQPSSSGPEKAGTSLVDQFCPGALRCSSG